MWLFHNFFAQDPTKYKQSLNRFIWLVNGNLTVTTIQGYSEPRSNGNERLIHIPQISWTGALPSNTVYTYRNNNKCCVDFGNND